MKYSKKLIVFDWDGTLMDSESRIVNCMRAAITDMDLPVRTRHELKNVIGLGLREALHALFPDNDEVQLGRLVERYRHHFLVEDKTPSELFAGVNDMLASLNGMGYFLAIATGKARRGLDHALTSCDVGHFFHASRCADETRSKPHPQMLEELIDYFGVAPHDSIMIGDTEFDMAMAKNAGTHALGVSYGVHEKDRLLNHGPLACLDDVSQLHAWLTSNLFIDTQGQAQR
jgi:phosphoglycolate phosphatase